MKHPCTLLFFLLLCSCVSAQLSVRGQVQDADGVPVSFANVALYVSADSSLVKVETTDEAGLFRMRDVPDGTYDLSVTFIGAPELRRPALTLQEDADLGVLTMAPAAVELTEATVTARRALVEVKPDRTVFNVQGTINAAGNTGLDLLRKAPGVTVDNNDNINVLSRSGVLLYVDGRRLPLSGEALSNYLRNLNAEQIDRIDIITNPGARYEAEGNAGIIDIRLKKAEDEGANGSLSLNGSQGRYFRSSVDANGNYRNRWLNLFGNAGVNDGTFYNTTLFNGFQNGLRMDEYIHGITEARTVSYRLGADITLAEDHTLGILVGGRFNDYGSRTIDDIDIFDLRGGTEVFDSTLRARGQRDGDRNQQTVNLNYRYRIAEGRTLNVDLDYGRFRTDNLADQSNRYFDRGGDPLSSLYNYFDTPTDIDIWTAQTDYEQPLAGGTLSAGGKFSRVRTYNTFLFYAVVPGAAGERVLDDRRSNQFDYAEDVYAGYLNYAGSLGERWKFSAGLRTELTDATGLLAPFREDLREPPVAINYLSFFPSAGLTYSLDARKGNTLNLAYGRRINRPDYNVLNPFRQQISQLSYERGNPFLSPEIVDNLELGYTLQYRYNFKLAYSNTANQITRLIGPDDQDPRAGFVSWDNLASQRIFSFNASAPLQLTEAWNLYVNASASHINNQADYGDGATIDVRVFSYSFYVQNTLNLPGDFTAEIGGYFSGPGVWGGVFRYNELGALNVGLQRKFLNDQLNVKLSGNDLFYTAGWNGYSEFDGLYSEGSGRWDSRRIALSLSYTFGNQKVKSRKRKTGLEAEASRVGE
ncbi:TonB-dependent receptor domain-containing protein [Lewinella sp. JB7]|uniref:TonB-dependent receptor domain-containing protein n=1 Tax=Lewinella sp. JB7 TaxID=2962887 RepID=UPI0020C97296|nr:TonB-dependent receptor [Lewinella sp. JB7]MCP9235886.1 TonB dependent receptor [Lewinella sp. JB7]